MSTDKVYLDLKDQNVELIIVFVRKNSLRTMFYNLFFKTISYTLF